MRHLIITLSVLFLSLKSFAVIGPIAGSASLCPGSAISLTDTSAGGTWSTSDATIATVGSSSGIVSGVAAGTAVITYTTGTGFVTAAVTVNALPLAFNVSGGGAYCAGSSGVTCGLSLSQTGTSYQLYVNGVPSGAPLAGTGAPLGFGLQTAAGNYTVSATNVITGCFRMMTGSATIGINPVPSPIGGPSTLCAGSSVGFTEGAMGGTVVMSNPSVATVDYFGGSVTGVSAGTATLTYTLGSGCYTTKTYTVSPGPLPISGPTGLCLGASVTLSSTPGGYWSSSNTSVATIGSLTGVVAGLSAGTTTIYYSLGSGCARTMNLAVTPAPPPITGPLTVCTGGSANLIEYGPGLWSSNDWSIATVNSSTGVVMGVSLGTTTINFIMATGCATSLTVTVVPAVCSGTPAGGGTSASSPVVCINSSVVLSLTGASSGCGYTYQWQTSTDTTSFTDIAGATSSTYLYTAVSSQYFRCKVTCQTTGFYSYSIFAPVIVRNTIASHSVSHAPDTVCTATDFYISACGTSPLFHVTTWFGDGSSTNVPLSTTGPCHADVFHNFAEPGTYTLKQVLYLGTVPQDSVSFNYEYYYCHTMPVRLYFDANSNCVYDSGDAQLLLPVTLAIDSNGVTIDTISATSGFYYKGRGSAGTVYGFRVIATPSGITLTCPSGAIYDTIHTFATDYQPKYFGFNCSSGPGYDLAIHASTQTGRHTQHGTIIVDNNFCVPEDVTVTMHFSPKYVYNWADPAPMSFSGNTLIWHFTGLSSTVPAPVITYVVDVPTPMIYSTWLQEGDTVQSTYITTGAAGGDIDTSNNVIIKNDTARGAWDPNEISVIPTGYILPCTQLQYTIRFENTGNDTAHNIYVMDTLSDNLDIHSLRMEVASGATNTTIIKNGGYTIAKFDLPGINLPDSTHSMQYNGMIVFNIKARQGITDATTITNHAGIFFDDNPAVLTNAVVNTIGISPVSGAGTVCIAANDTLWDKTGGGIWRISNGHATVAGGIVSGNTAGLDTVIYTVSNSCAARSTSKVININPLPHVGAVSGDSAVCAGSVLSLTDTTAGGTWTSGNTTVATVSGTGVVSGVTAGSVLISYTTANSCGAITAAKTVTVNPLPLPVSGAVAVCIGANTILIDSASGGAWSSGNPAIAAIGSTTGLVNGIAAGASTIIYTLPTSCYRTFSMNVNPLPNAYLVTGGGSYCAGGAGAHVGLGGSVTGTDYMLYHSTTAVDTVHGSGSSLDFGLQTLAGSYTVAATNITTTCENRMSDSARIAIIPNVLPSVSVTVTPSGAVCAGTIVHFNPVAVNGGTHPAYTWNVNGTDVAYSSTYHYAPANGDMVKVKLVSDEHCVAPDTAGSAVTMDVAHVLVPTVSVSVTPAGALLPGTAATFSAAVSGAGTPPAYQWLNRQTYIAGATNANYTTNNLHDEDTITCIVVTANECGSVVVAGSATVAINTTGLRGQILTGSFNVFPNPTNGEFTVAYTLPGNDDALFQITDIAGRLLFEQALGSKPQTAVFNIKSFDPGVYLYRVVQNGVAIYVGKIVKE